MLNDFVIRQNAESLRSKISYLKSMCEERGADGEILEELGALENMLFGKSEDDQMPLEAQLSIYPLRQPSLSMTINEALEVLKTYGFKLIPGSMSTLILGDATGIWAALKEVFSVASGHGEVVMIVTVSNACPKPQAQEDAY